MGVNWAEKANKATPFEEMLSYQEEKKEMFRRMSPFLVRKLEDAAAELKQLLAGYRDDQKVALIYRMLTDTVTYDNTYQHISYSLAGVVQKTSGVCQGISELLVFLIGECTGARAYRVSGYTLPEGRHSWNLIELNTSKGKKAYFMDATWDLGKKTWRYYLVGDKLRKSRMWNPIGLPFVSEEDYTETVYKDDKKSEELATWFRGLSGRFAGSIYQLV